MTPPESSAPAAVRPAAPAALALEGVSKHYGGTQVLRGIDLVLAAGACHALIGPNGAGKSTLFDIVSGRQAPSAGRVRLHGRDITGLPAHRVARRGLARSFQSANVFASLSVFDNLRCAALRACGHGYDWWRGLGRLAGVAERARQVMAQLGLAGRAAVPAGQLSYAEQRALELGMVLATRAGVLLLDEPTAGMNRAEAARMTALIAQTCAGRTVLIVEHDMRVVFELAQRVSVLVYGELIATGTPDAIARDERVRDAYLGRAGCPARR